MTLRMFGASARDLAIGPWRLLPERERRVATVAVTLWLPVGVALGAMLSRL